jgi:hypothetical protein
VGVKVDSDEAVGGRVVGVKGWIVEVMGGKA